MTRKEAESKCTRLAAEHAQRETHQWQPRQEPGGDWTVVKIALPPPDKDWQAELRADEKPPEAEDPRDIHIKNVGPYIGG